ncbi:MAG TPA: hypothetical protein PLY79_10910 [Ferruginibacter sp.]|nr:hypothetical protein [Ferruginibacter sp.]
MEHQTPQSTKWYNKQWLVFLLCVVFFPVGLYALWKSNNIAKGWKIAGSVIIGFFVIASFGKESKYGRERSSTSSTQLAADEIPSDRDKPELSQAQLDSIASAVQARKDSIEFENRKQVELAAQQVRAQEIADKSLDVAQLFKDYERNEPAADKKYKGKEFILSGKVTEVKKDFFGYTYAILEVGGNKARCDLPDNDYAASLEIGETITLIGDCDGTGAGQSLGIGKVIMRRCKPF